MINKINFTGRETMLTKGVKEVASNAHKYVGTGKMYSPEEIDVIERMINKAQNKDSISRVAAESAEARYTSPFAPTEETAQVASKQAQRVQDETNGYLYNVAHGKPDYVADENVTEPRAILNLLA